MIEKIKVKIKEGQYRLSKHALKRCDEREILEKDVIKIILEGKVVESYPEDKPYPSFLILGYINEKPLYVLCAINELAHIITVHWLDPEKWLDPITRREKKI
ncbi:MAG: hypothetical protein COY53_09820 [Elusimicrobia bacterium CG_4_10_14_0_8_um_filter_37_32]|nr:MAG: hypothetical protein COY53_09820 [Elusimicrobia bacterium CG_4_10_14_0_8_um_filter_37_32]